MLLEMIIADLFMAATVFAYAYVKGLRTVPGRIFLFLSISMLTVYIFYPLIVFHFMSTILEYFIVFMLLSGFLNSFLWMSVISFDIWWTFRYLWSLSIIFLLIFKASLQIFPRYFRWHFTAEMLLRFCAQHLVPDDSAHFFCYSNYICG